MKHKLLFAAATAALLAPSAAFAQDSGVYLKGQIGLGGYENIDITNDTNITPNTITGEVGGDAELAGALGVGYDFGNNWRIELDGSQYFSSFDTISGNPASDAKLRTNVGMLNVLYDFEGFNRFKPYVGAGVGIADGKVRAFAHDLINPNAAADRLADNNIIRHPNCTTIPVADTTGRSCDIDDKDTNFAWNLLIGLGYDVTDNLTWATDYRYSDLGTFNVDGTTTFVDGLGMDDPVIGTLGSDFEDVVSHSIMTGFRYRFGASEPEVVVVPVVVPEVVMFTCWNGTEVTDAALCPPEPAPEPETFTCEGSGQVVTDLALCPPRTECPDGSVVYGPAEFCPQPITRTGETVQSLCGQEFRQEIIYYEFNRGQSAETRNTINRILDIGQFCQVDNIRVVGHTDTSGAAAYNLNLSRRRAADAREELVRQGIDPAIITSEGKGETEPFVQTGDGVREQLNRRTEVLIQLSDVGMAMPSGN